MPAALLLVDLQRDYFPGGRLPLVGSEAAVARAAEALARFRTRGLPVVHMQHLSLRPGATFFLPHTEGVEIHECVAPRAGETVLRKHFPNSFRGTGLADHLAGLGVDHLVVAGMMTSMCVDASVRAAFDGGLRCTVLADACATRDLAFEGEIIPAAQVHGAFLAALGSVYAKVVGVAELEAALAAQGSV